MFKRLVLTGSLAKEQAQAVKHLMDSEGLCTCGRFFRRTDAKLCLGQINTDYFPDPKYKNTLVIAAYCVECATLINNTLISLKGANASNEPDRVRHEGNAKRP